MVKAKRKPGRPKDPEGYRMVLAVRLDAPTARRIRAMVADEDRPLSRVLRRLIQAGLESLEGSGGKAAGSSPRKQPRKD